MKEIALAGINSPVLANILTALLEDGRSVDVFTTNPERMMLDTTNVTVNRFDYTDKLAEVQSFTGFDTVILAHGVDLTNDDVDNEILRYYAQTVNAAREAGVKRLIVVGNPDSEAFYRGELERRPELNSQFISTTGDYARAVVRATERVEA